MIKLNVIYLSIIAILVTIIFLQRGCKPQGSIVITKVDTVFDTHHDTVYKHDPQITYVSIPGKPIIKHDTVYNVTQEQIDTSSVQDIVNDWYTTRIYSDTNVSKYGKFYIKDTISRNKLQSRQIIADWNIPTTIHQQITIPKVTAYLGFDIGSDGKTLAVGPLLSLQVKTGQIYQVGASYIGNLGMYYHFGTSWQLFTKHK